MKVRININSELWERFRNKVNDANLVLDEVVPQVIEPALKAYCEPQEPSYSTNIFKDEQELPIIDRITPFKQVPQPPAPTKRCELCDMPAERLFSVTGRKVCYACWKKAITAPSVETTDTQAGS